MKNILLAISLILTGSMAFGQITNGGFENWSAESQCMSPDNWGTLNGSTGILGVCTAQQETSNPNSGSSSLLINTQFIGFPINQNAPGIVTNGTINTNTQAVEGGQAFTERPTSFSGWYQATPVNGDTYSFSALLINENSGDTIGFANWENTAVVNTWTQFTATVTYYLPDDPTLLQIILLPSDPSNPQVGSEALFDDIDYETLTVGLSESDREQIKTYPNPVVDQVTFSLGTIGQANLEIFNLLGSRIHTETLSGTNRMVDMSSFAKGTYIWQLSSISGEPLKTGKLMLVK